MKFRIPNGSSKKNKKEITYALTLIGQLGITMAVALLLSVLAGNFIDSKLGTSPVFLLIFCMMGILAAFKEIYLMTMKYWNGKK